MREWSAFYPLVLPWTPGASDPAMDSALRQASIRFCEETQCLQRTLDPIRTVAGMSAYDLDIDAGEAVARLLSVSIDGTPATLITALQSDDERRDGETAAYTLDRATLALAPAPAAGGGRIVVKTAVKPTQDAKGVDDAVHEQYAQGIAAGAIALLCSQIGKPWSNPQMAATGAQAFSSAQEDAKARIAAGHARVRLRVKPH